MGMWREGGGAEDSRRRDGGGRCTERVEGDEGRNKKEERGKVHAEGGRVKELTRKRNGVSNCRLQSKGCEDGGKEGWRGW